MNKIHECLGVAQRGHRSVPPENVHLRFYLVLQTQTTDFHTSHQFRMAIACNKTIIPKKSEISGSRKNTRVKSTKTRVSGKLQVSSNIRFNMLKEHIFTFQMPYWPRKSDQPYTYSEFFCAQFLWKKQDFLV